MTPKQLNKSIKMAVVAISDIEIKPCRKTSSGRETAVKGKVALPSLGYEVAYNSSIERDFVLACRLDKRISNLISQPFSISFETSNLQSDRVYTPDYYIERDLSVIPSQFEISTRCKEIIIEVKRKSDLNFLNDHDIERLAAGAYWAMQSPERDFLIINDDYFNGNQGEAIRLLSGYVGVNASDAALLLVDLCKRSSPLALDVAYDLLTMSGYKLEDAEEAVLVSIANGWIETADLKIPSGKDDLYWRETNEVLNTKTGQDNS